MALDRAIVDEMEVAAQVSDEEWEAIRPTKQERSSSLVKHIEVKISLLNTQISFFSIDH